MSDNVIGLIIIVFNYPVMYLLITKNMFVVISLLAHNGAFFHNQKVIMYCILYFRACRLKKKAQHEANKIKLFGLEHEHKKLLSGIQQMKQLLIAKLNSTDTANRDEINKHVDKVIKTATSKTKYIPPTLHSPLMHFPLGFSIPEVKIAGHTTDYVNRVLDKVRSGVADGGLDEF